MTMHDPSATWLAANLDHLVLSAERIRLLLRRHIAWLRQTWSDDPLNDYRGLVISDEKADLLLGHRDGRRAAFYAADADVQRMDAQIRGLAQRIERARARSVEHGCEPALEALSSWFELSAFARDTLLLAFVPELDPDFEPLFAYAQDDATRRYATANLALAVLADTADPLADRRALDPSAPLRRYRLIAIDDGPSACTFGGRAMLVPERVQSFLRGDSALAPTAAGLLRPVAPAPLTAAQSELAARLASRIGRESGLLSLNLLGAAGTGRRAVAEALCAHLGLRLQSLDIAAVARDARAFEERKADLEREVRLSRLAIYVDAATLDDATDPDTRRYLISAIDRLDASLIVGGTRRWPGVRLLVPSTVPRLDSTGRRAVWNAALIGEGFEPNGGVDLLVHQFELGPSGIAEAARAARHMAALQDGEAPLDPVRLVWIACRERSGPTLDDLAQRIEPSHDWNDIVLPDDAFRQLREIAAQVRLRTLVYETWGFGRKLGRGLGISALFSGPSGTGKTFAAEILAGEFDLALYRIDLAGVVSKYIGETEKNLKKVFDAAEDSGAVLFFDEADALFGKRTEVRDSHDRYANIEINYLLQRMEDYAGLVVMATNMKSALDPAFLRRLRFIVDFPFPDAALRRRIWEKSFPAPARVDGLDHDALSRLTIPGGNIRNIALNAAFLAADEASSIAMRHIYHAARREYEKIEKLVVEAEFGARARSARS
jgi:hypothetical protein